MAEKPKKEVNDKSTIQNDKSKHEVVTSLNEVLEDLAQPQEDEPQKLSKGEPVTLLADDLLTIGQRKYRLVKDHRSAFVPERLGERYSDVLSRYDYVVGDWGYDQLRLKGFFKAENRKAPADQRIDALEDYLYEFCNFGCAYFVLERIGGKREKPVSKPKKKRQNKPNPKKNPAHIEEKKGPVASGGKTKKAPVFKQRKQIDKSTVKEQPKSQGEGTPAVGNKRHFTIRKKEDGSQSS